jgi:hypothetical protein
MNRAAVAALAILAVLGGIGLGMFAAMSASPGATPATGSGLVAGLGSAVPSAVPSATPTPGPSLVPAPLTGALVSAAAAARHPIAVMIDDQIAARPQSGLSSASIVWQAPAEGGIPRYMLIFQETTPTDVGPVRSARYYYVAWASELRAMYVHSGGSPQALATLRAQGNGQLVYNADEFRWGGSFHRISTRASPHNLYTTGAKLRALATRVGARDGPITWPWTFARDAVLGWRPVGGRIVVSYQANVIRYDYDRKTNTYLRSVTGEKRQVDGTTKRRIAPKNVIVMQVRFGPLNDGNPSKKRLEADIIGSGPAWISTNGITIKGTWRKASTKAPTRFFDKAGKPVVLTVGQTFVQVMKTTDSISFTPGKPAPPDPRTPGPLPL